MYLQKTLVLLPECIKNQNNNFLDVVFWDVQLFLTPPA